MSDNRLLGKPDEQLWDHANRLVIEIMIPPIVKASPLLLNPQKENAHLIGIYTQCFGQNKKALRSLLQSREILHNNFIWNKSSSDKWVGPLMTPNDSVVNAVNDASLSFIEFVKSWQPLMDALAGIIWLALDTSKTVKLKKIESMTELVRISKNAKWPPSSDSFETILGESLEWYMNNVRIMRNQFVHNERVALLIPEAGTQQTIVQIKKLENQETLDEFRLDKFLGWVYGHFLLSCTDFAIQVESLF